MGGSWNSSCSANCTDERFLGVLSTVAAPALTGSTDDRTESETTELLSPRFLRGVDDWINWRMRCRLFLPIPAMAFFRAATLQRWKYRF